MLLYIINRRIITNKIAVIVIIFFLTIVFNSYSAPPENNPSDPCSNHYLWQSFVNTKSYATFTLNNCEYYGCRGSCHAEFKKYENAIEDYRKAILINPEYARAWQELAITYGKLNRYNDAIDVLHEALRINPEHYGLWYNLVIAYILSGNRTAAINTIEELQRINPEMADNLLKEIMQQ